ncbi:hypothetical protein DEJ48_10750 [Streptomyces venezuelae]|uniref:Uncharacterized protein n=1 Tax=Streptomyces venezuelae TaxID=54571 RepID=A0A5P2BXP3_STRVZ|nr:hypothetical protein [Streptomyces venezuelae]QES33801.1 hypothetical protein DEJ48_10750 [Streptomyces venezuelae]
MNYADTVQDLSPALTALRLLAVDFAQLPAPTERISPIVPKELDLSLHGDLGAFEPWRAALGIAREDIDFHTQGDGQTWVLCADTDYAGARVTLYAYGDVLRRTLTLVGGCHAA